MTFVFLLCLIYLNGSSQIRIPSDTLTVGYRMTSNLIFPYPLKKVDIGSSGVIGQRAGEMDNVLLVKARQKNFEPTNLSVYTTDGKFYSFIVMYNEQPDTLNISFTNNPSGNTFPVRAATAARLDSDALLIRKQDGFLHKRVRKDRMSASLTGIYLIDHLLWFRIRIVNNSGIDYTTENVKFFIRDRRVAKRTAAQEREKIPVWKSVKTDIPGKSADEAVFAFPSFALSGQKELAIGISDKEGGRTLLLRLNYRAILRVRNIY